MKKVLVIALALIAATSVVTGCTTYGKGKGKAPVVTNG